MRQLSREAAGLLTTPRDGDLEELQPSSPVMYVTVLILDYI